MHVTTSKNILTGYANYLAEYQLLDKQVVLNAFQKTSLNKTSFIEYLIKNKILNESYAAQSIAEYFGLPLCDLKSFNLNLVPKELLSIKLVHQHLALPLYKNNNVLYLAVIDPTLEHLSEMKFLTGLDTVLVIVEMGDLEQVIDELLNSLILSEIKGIDEESLNQKSINAYEDEMDELSNLEIDSGPVVNYVNRVLLDAIEKQASDIHFEHYEENYQIRFRQHGILYPITAPPLKIANYLLARIKVMSGLDITEHRVPQDGRFKLILSKKKSVDFRVSICPTLFGEKVVLRILDATNTLQSVNSLGMDSIQNEHFINALQHSQGMILVTGPTGSGKTVTLYSALHYLNSPEKNILTVEDPVEIPLLGINQVNVNIKTGLNFSNTLRSFLRQDPDIIMVGEIRDLETAEIAIKAAQTGHLVLSTLHTNNAPETITRLMNMGIESYYLAASLKIVVAQRLIRILCDKCKQKEIVNEAVLMKEGFLKDEIGSFELYGPRGCEHCTRGFVGRAGIFEVMPIFEEMAQLIMSGGNAIQITELAKKRGIVTLRDAGLKKVKEGKTSLSELNRVFK